MQDKPEILGFSQDHPSEAWTRRAETCAMRSCEGTRYVASLWKKRVRSEREKEMEVADRWLVDVHCGALHSRFHLTPFPKPGLDATRGRTVRPRDELPDRKPTLLNRGVAAVWW